MEFSTCVEQRVRLATQATQHGPEATVRTSHASADRRSRQAQDKCKHSCSDFDRAHDAHACTYRLHRGQHEAAEQLGVAEASRGEDELGRLLDPTMDGRVPRGLRALLHV